MLVLDRKKDKVIRVGDDIKIIIVQVKANGHVKIGIEAPKDIPVHREEIYDAIHKDDAL